MAFDWDALRKAHETRDADLLLSLYGDDPELKVVDVNNPPNKPHVVTGKRALTEHIVDACGRNLTDEISNEVDAGDRAAFTVTCRYPTGEMVIAQEFVELDDAGKIASALIVQAWDS